jgi:hypothetical protein
MEEIENYFNNSIDIYELLDIPHRSNEESVIDALR